MRCQHTDCSKRRALPVERVHELLRTGESASEVAGAAQRFGQEDDISVIAVTRTAVQEPAYVSIPPGATTRLTRQRLGRVTKTPFSTSFVMRAGSTTME